MEALVVVLNQNKDKVLMGYNSDGLLDFIRGNVKPMEEGYNACGRVLAEELGVCEDVVTLKFLKFEQHTTIRNTGSIYIMAGILGIKDFEHEHYGWVDIKDKLTLAFKSVGNGVSLSIIEDTKVLFNIGE